MGSLIFTGNGNIPLAKTIASELGTKLSPLEIIRFADSECRVRVEADVAGKDVFVIQSLRNPVDEHLMELLLISDALKREEAKRVIAVLPYHGYARQDRVHRPGECLSSQVVAKLIEAVGYDKIITVDLHSDAIVGFFKIPVVQLSGLSLFYPVAERIKNEIVVISPDAGAMRRSQRFAEHIDAPLAFIEKKRNLDKLHTIEYMNVVGNVKGKTALIVDDIIVTGGTLVNAAHFLKQKGVKEVVAVATHADLVGGSDKILKDSPIDKIWVSDTIQVSADQRFDKLEIVTSSKLISEAIRKLLK